MARALIQEAKAGRRPILDLIMEARELPDPSFAAEALLALSSEPRLATGDAVKVLDEVSILVSRIERGWRRAEVLAELGKKGQRWRDIDPGSADARQRFLHRLVEAAATTPPGQARSQAIQAVAPYAAGRSHHLLGAAVTNPGFAFEDGKAVLKAGTDASSLAALVAQVERAEEPELRAKLWAALDHHARKAGLRVPDALARAVHDASQAPEDQRVETLRYIASVAEGAEAIEELHTSSPVLDPSARVRFLASIAGRADKAGDRGRAQSWLGEASGLLVSIPASARAGVQKNLAEAMRRAGMGIDAAMAAEMVLPRAIDSAHDDESVRPTALPGSALSPGSAPSIPTSLGGGHVLALYDAYEGGLKEVHLRAVARAAPLCWAFGLDLALMGFPVRDIDEVVRAASRETNIGDGGRYLEDLAAARRIILVPCTSREPPTDWSVVGLPVATTSEPHPRRGTDFDGAVSAAQAAGAKRICVIMGLGKRGLPPSLLRVVPHHLELTGRGISMETATAMGVIAERMRALPRL